MLIDMKTKYTYKDLLDMLEILDVHDSVKKIQYEKALAEAANNKG